MDTGHLIDRRVSAGTLPISIVIPTYGRDDILIATIKHLLDLEPKPAEILVLDQTEKHQEIVESTLAGWKLSGAVKLILFNRAINTARYELWLMRIKTELCPIC